MKPRRRARPGGGLGPRGRRRLRLAALCAVLAAVATWAVREALVPGPWQRVFLVELCSARERRVMVQVLGT